MPRKYVRKTERYSWDAQNMNETVAMVQKGIMLRSAADQYQMPKTTLRRQLQKLLHKPDGSKHLGKLCLLGPDKELELINHIAEFERKGFPLTIMDIQKLAFGITLNVLLIMQHKRPAKTGRYGLKNDVKTF